MSTIQVSPENHAEIKRYCTRHGHQIGEFADAAWEWLRSFQEDVDIFSDGTPYIPEQVSEGANQLMPVQQVEAFVHEIQNIKAEHRNEIKAIVDALALPNLLSQGVEYGRQIAEAEIKRKELIEKHQEEINLITEGANARIDELSETCTQKDKLIRELQEQLAKCKQDNLKYYGAFCQLKEAVETHKWYHGKIEIPDI